MTIDSTSQRVDFVGDDSTDLFPYTFRIFSATDLFVVQRVVGSGTDTVLVLDSDYTVSGVGDLTGGSITLTAGNLPIGTVMAILRVRPLTQLTDIKNGGDFFPEAHEDTFDHLVMLAQQLKEENVRTLRLPPSVSSDDVDAELPVPQALQFFRWNATASALENVSVVVVSGTVVIPGGTGILVKQSPTNSDLGVREIIANEGLEIADGDGVSGNPTVGIKTSGVTNIKVATDAIDQRTIAASGVGNAQVQTDAIDARTIAASGVGNAQVDTDAIDARTIAVSGVGNLQMQTDSVDNRVLAASAVAAVNIQPGAITASALGAGSPRRIEFSQTQVGNTVSEVSLLSHTFASGTIAVGDQVLIRSAFKLDTGNIGVRAYRVRMKLNGTRIYDFILSHPGGVGVNPIQVVVWTRFYIISNTLVVANGETEDLLTLGALIVSDRSELEDRANRLAVSDITSNPLTVEMAFFWDGTLPSLDPSLLEAVHTMFYDGAQE